MTGGYLARLMRGPIPLDMYKPVSGQQVGPVRIRRQSKPDCAVTPRARNG